MQLQSTITACIYNNFLCSAPPFILTPIVTAAEWLARSAGEAVASEDNREAAAILRLSSLQSSVTTQPPVRHCMQAAVPSLSAENLQHYSAQIVILVALKSNEAHLQKFLQWFLINIQN